MGKTVTWLHISDMHMCAPQTGWDADRILDSLGEDLKHLGEEYSLRPALIFFTGDLAYGHISEVPEASLRQQFSDALRVLNGLRDTLQLSSERLFIVPGNHDVDRRKVTEDQTAWLDRSRNVEAITDMINKKCVQWSRYIERLHAYKSALERAGLDHLLTDPDRLIYGCTREVNGVTLGVAGFNSAWSCARREEKGRLWTAGRWQAEVLHRQLGDADLTVALIHHPGSWYREPEQRCWQLIKARFDVVLHGHKHELWVAEPENKSSAATLAAGACYGGTTSENNGYSVVKVDVEARAGRAWLRRYERSGRGGWVPRVISEVSNLEGIVEFSVPRSPKQSVPRRSAPDLSEREHDESLWKGFLEGVKARNEYCSWLGQSIPHIPVNTFFSPAPDSSLPLQQPLKKHRRIDELLDLDLPGEEVTPRYWLVRGEAGHGKTTLLRRAAFDLARKWRRFGDRVPLLNSMDDFEWEGEVLIRNLAPSVPSPIVWDLLEQECDRGRVVFMFDGLDRIAPDHRDAARAYLAHLQGRWRTCPIVVTSRVEHEGPVLAAFEPIKLQPLHRKDQRRFLTARLSLGHGSSANDDLAQATIKKLVPTRKQQRDKETRSDRRASDRGSIVGSPLFLLSIATVAHQDGWTVSNAYSNLIEALIDGRSVDGRDDGNTADLWRGFVRILATGWANDGMGGELVDEIGRRLRQVADDSPELRQIKQQVQQRGLRNLLDDLASTGIIEADAASRRWRFTAQTFQDVIASEWLEVHWVPALGMESFDGVLTKANNWRDALVHWAVRARPEAQEQIVLAIATQSIDVAVAVALRCARLGPGCFRALAVHQMEPDTMGLLARHVVSGMPSEHSEFILRSLADHARRAGTLPKANVVDSALASLLASDDQSDLTPARRATLTSLRKEIWENLRPEAPGTLTVTTSEGETELLVAIPPEQALFRISRVPVTVRLYRMLDPSYSPPSYTGRDDVDDLPAVGLSARQAEAFCIWLGGRLPTTKEWTLASGAGAQDGLFFDSDLSKIERYAWVDERPSDGGPRPVGRKQPNPWGLYDVYGNVWEWCSDTVLDESGFRMRVVRGGSCWSKLGEATLLFQGRQPPQRPLEIIGFRVLMPVDAT